ncbi:MAG TPA: glycosyltransferase [Acidimicrobiales bacterium]
MSPSPAHDAVSVVVSVGTDHHPFARLIEWTDRWAADHPEAPVLVQYGTSPPPSVARGTAYLGFDELRARFAAAAAIVSHGGPATIMDARAAGRLPIVVPRDPALGEHVDGHQQRFSRWMAERNQIRLADDEAAFRRLLDEALSSPDHGRVDAKGTAEVAATVGRFADLVGQLLDP